MTDADVIVVEMSVPRDFLGVGPARTIVADVDMATRKKRLIDKGMALEDIIGVTGLGGLYRQYPDLDRIFYFVV